MKFTSKTEYGIVCLTIMARLYKTKRIVTAQEMTDQENFSKPFVEKILQTLKHANIVAAQQGKGGGYSLSRPPSEISFREIVDALEGSTFGVFCDEPNRENIICNHLCLCGLKPIWKKTKEILDTFYESLSLQTLAANGADLPNVQLVTEARTS